MCNIAVAPLVGAWIEINPILLNVDTEEFMSLLSWERGLKLRNTGKDLERDKVAPLVGAWIEISVGVVDAVGRVWSLLSWERGLK